MQLLTTILNIPKCLITHAAKVVISQLHDQPILNAKSFFLKCVEHAANFFFSFVLSARRGLAERSTLIRHPSSKQYQEDVLRYQQQLNEFNKNNPTISVENHQFIKDVSTYIYGQTI